MEHRQQKHLKTPASDGDGLKIIRPLNFSFHLCEKILWCGQNKQLKAWLISEPAWSKKPCFFSTHHSLARDTAYLVSLPATGPPGWVPCKGCLLLFHRAGRGTPMALKLIQPCPGQWQPLNNSHALLSLAVYFEMKAVNDRGVRSTFLKSTVQHIGLWFLGTE